MNIHTLTYGIDEIETVTEELIRIMPLVSIMTFTGPLGAGKTLLIQSVLKKYGVTVPVVSPTFTYLTIYGDAAGHEFYHFDLYRLKSLAEFRHAGFEEYLYQPKSWSFIEWPEIIKPIIKKKTCDISIEYCDENLRRLIYSINS